MLPQSKPPPQTPLHALTVVQHRFSAAVRLVAAGKCGYPKDMETGVRCVIRRTVAVRRGNWCGSGASRALPPTDEVQCG